MCICACMPACVCSCVHAYVCVGSYNQRKLNNFSNAVLRSEATTQQGKITWIAFSLPLPQVPV